MSMSSDPTHPKITEDANDVEAHAYRKSALPDETQPEPEGLEKVGRPQERSTGDDVEGHSIKGK